MSRYVAVEREGGAGDGSGAERAEVHAGAGVFKTSYVSRASISI